MDNSFFNNFSLSTLLASGALSGLIAGIWQYFAKQKDYQDEYYKKIIDKRLKVYEKLDKIHANFLFRQTIDYTNTNDETYMDKELLSCCADPKSALQTSQRLKTLGDDFLWLSNDAFILIGKIQHEMSRLAKFRNDEKFIISAYDTSKIIKDLVKQLANTITKDMLTLYDIKGFLKTKKAKQDIEHNF